MRHVSKVRSLAFAVSVATSATALGCASNPPLHTEASTSGTRAAEHVGASNVPRASLHLQLAKEDLQRAGVMAADGNKAQTESMLLRADADAEPAVALVREDAEIADQRAATAQAALASLAAVKDEPRGLVITLSGSVLFASGQAVLLPDARSRLNQVADVLLTTRERVVTVEGHTDSKGSDSSNLDLSQRRAEAVRTYLVVRGYEGDLIQAHGLGEAQPIADNASAEGRANNRRVQIVIAREVHSSNQ